MNSNFSNSAQGDTSMDVDPNSQTNINNNNCLHDGQEVPIDEIRQELQIKRDTRNTSEKFRDHELPDGISNDSDSTRESSPQISPASIENLDEPPLQLPSPGPTSNQHNSLQVMSGRILNLLHNVVSPIRQPPLARMAEPIEQPRPQPNPMLSLFSSLPTFHHNRNDLRGITNHDEEEANNTNDQHEQANESQTNENQPHETDNLEHGAIIVRTVTPGPNGLMIVRMRLIPLDEVFGTRNNNIFEDPDHLRAGLLGALVRLLASANDLHMERGLEKEALDNLPVVIYDSEGFKNVEEDNKKCPICFDHYEDGQEIRYLWCMHRFHKGCVDQWLGSHTNCPICKKDYSEAEKEDFE